MCTGVTFFDGLDGLVGGIATTLALIGLSVTALSICLGTLLFLPTIVFSQSCNPTSLAYLVLHLKTIGHNDVFSNVNSQNEYWTCG